MIRHYLIPAALAVALVCPLAQAAIVPFDVAPDIAVQPAGEIVGGTLIGSPYTYYNIQFDVDGGADDINLRTARAIDAGGPGVDQIVSDGFNGSQIITKGANSYINTPFGLGDVIGDGIDEAGRGADVFNVIHDGGYQLFAEGDNYLGFQLASGNYGYVQVNYESATHTYTFLEGAYEDTGASITVGDSGVPEPSALSVAVLAALCTVARRRF